MGAGCHGGETRGITEIMGLSPPHPTAYIQLMFSHSRRNVNSLMKFKAQSVFFVSLKPGSPRTCLSLLYNLRVSLLIVSTLPNSLAKRMEVMPAFGQCFVVHWCDNLGSILLPWICVSVRKRPSIFLPRKFTSTVLSTVYIYHPPPPSTAKWHWKYYALALMLLKQQTLLHPN